jgi:DNA helicase-2/ATP-dependent DNA helicase PcrA
MRNGKHETNSPSRFIREVNPKFISNPLSEDEIAGQAGNDDNTPAFGGWGRRFGNQTASRSSDNYSRKDSGSYYGRSGPAVAQKKPSSTVQPVISRPKPVSARVPDSDFTPTPVLQLRAGQRIEHNRFGFGQIVEISGNPADLKARIAFDDHGEKILLLKYAKIRVV